MCKENEQEDAFDTAKRIRLTVGSVWHVKIPGCSRSYEVQTAQLKEVTKRTVCIHAMRYEISDIEWIELVKFVEPTTEPEVSVLVH